MEVRCSVVRGGELWHGTDGGIFEGEEVGGRGAGVEAEDVVVLIALGGGVAGVADEAADFAFVEGVGGSCGGDDVFLHHDGAEVVGAEEEGELADFGAHGDPGGLDGGEVVEVEASDGEGAEVLGGACGSEDAAVEDVLVGGVIEGAVGEGVVFSGAAEGGVFALEGPVDEGGVGASCQLPVASGRRGFGEDGGVT